MPTFYVDASLAPMSFRSHVAHIVYVEILNVLTASYEFDKWCLLVHFSTVLCFDIHTLVPPCALLRCTPTSCSEMYTSPLSDASTCPHLLFPDLLL